MKIWYDIGYILAIFCASPIGLILLRAISAFASGIDTGSNYDAVETSAYGKTYD